MSAGDRDTLAAVLAKHQPRTVWEPSNYNDPASSGHPIGVSCSCGWGVEGGNSDDLHRAHVADVLLESDWLREQRAEAWDQGATHADREWQHNEYNNDGSTPGYEYWDTDVSANPYRTTEDTDG